ncbi:MAG TPA: 4'-phosphopantetheinyl transferase superfamily protein [Gammaproteobacteria bacterium]
MATSFSGGFTEGSATSSTVVNAELKDAEFHRAAAAALPAPIIHHGGAVSALQAPLHPEESGFVASAVERRVQEFTAGRHCARIALGQLGFGNVPVRMGARRQPLWPVGIVGSISHSAGYCLAAVTTRDSLAGLGVDIEHASPLDASLTGLVCTPMENAAIARYSADNQGLAAKALFSAKEAVFKCLYPVFGEELDFHDVEVELDIRGGRFDAQVSRLALNADADLRLKGRLTYTAQTIMTAALLHDSDLDVISCAHAGHSIGNAGHYLCGLGD